jgi:alkylation response protein AidB-like acyl-CoA dehydrogenase
MEFAFTEEQEMIRDAVAGFLAEHSTSAAVRAAMASETGFDSALWHTVCRDMVWQATHLPEAVGGMGLGFVELAAIMEQMGRFLFCGPFFSTVCLAANALRVAAAPDQQQRFLAPIAEGRTATLAWCGPRAGHKGGDWRAEAVEAIYVRDDAGFVVSGDYRYVIDGASAQTLIVAARRPGSQGREGIALFALPADTDGVTRQALPTMDQTRRQGALRFSNVRVPVADCLGENLDAGALLAITLDLATIALAAEQVGGAQDIMDKAVAYTQERVQFGRQVSSFQAIKHKAADMMLRTEVARSGVYYAACVAEEALAALEGRPAPLAPELAEAASIAKSYVSDAYFFNAGEALQMHGGVGFTWEYDVHLHFKRAKASEHFLGTGAAHRERIAGLLLDGGAA